MGKAANRMHVSMLCYFRWEHIRLATLVRDERPALYGLLLGRREMKRGFVRLHGRRIGLCKRLRKTSKNGEGRAVGVYVRKGQEQTRSEPSSLGLIVISYFHVCSNA